MEQEKLIMSNISVKTETVGRKTTRKKIFSLCYQLESELLLQPVIINPNFGVIKNSCDSFLLLMLDKDPK